MGSEIMVAIGLINLFSFALMVYDKHCSKHNMRRVPEANLFLAAACFGALGGVLGMFLLRHKTRHRNFRIFFPLMLAGQVILLVLGHVLPG